MVNPTKDKMVTAQKNASGEAAQSNATSGEAAMHECNFCGKSFKNGKALGGHRRSHFQAAKVKSRLSNLSKASTSSNNNKKDLCDDDDDSGNNGYNDEKHTCYLCKRDFPSNHSLYGHMRSHPERLWKGVSPPIHSHNNINKHSSSSSSLSSNFEEDHDHDDEYDEAVVAPIDISKSSSLPRWQMTGKRGRKSTSANEAAENLVLMSLRNNNFLAIEFAVVEPKSHQSSIIPCERKNIGEASSGEKHLPKKIKFYASKSLKLGNNIDGCDTDKVNRREVNLSELKDETILVNMDCEEEIEKDSGSMNIEEDAVEDHVGNFDERKKMKKKIGRKLLLKKPKAPDSESIDKSLVCNETTQKKVNGYECDICWKSFTTFQGLGGHRSIHNKEKNNAMNVAESKPSDHAVSDDVTLRGLVIEAANDEVQTEEDASPSQFLGPRILDFDLNMSPDDMDD